LIMVQLLCHLVIIWFVLIWADIADPSPEPNEEKLDGSLEELSSSLNKEVTHEDSDNDDEKVRLAPIATISEVTLNELDLSVEDIDHQDKV
jgi:hypothetical protein